MNQETAAIRAELSLPDEARTLRLGRALASAISAQAPSIASSGLQINLLGDLGAGKTTLVRALLRALDVSGPVKSPTFSLLEPYSISSLNFYHFDFYRFRAPSEFSGSGFRELFGPGSICAVEWPEKAGDELPQADLCIALAVEAQGRIAQLSASTEAGQQCLRNVLKEFEAPPAAA